MKKHMLKKIKLSLSKINLKTTKYKRILAYIENLEKHIEIHSREDRNTLKEIKELIDDRIKRIKRLFFLNVFFYIGIYFSIVSYFFAGTIIFDQIAYIFRALLSVFGTTIFFIGIYVTTRVTELYYQDLNLLSAHLISIYNNNELEKQPLFKDENSYGAFVEFFRKRGF